MSDQQVPTARATADGDPGQARVDGAGAAQIRARRERLRVELMRLEQVVSSPSGDADTFTSRVARAAASMRDTLREHVAETEAADGLFAQVAQDAPWLEGRIDPLRLEHAVLLAAADDLVERCKEGEPQQLRDQALELLASVSRHRQQGTDLLYDAYLVDISAAD